MPPNPPPNTTMLPPSPPPSPPPVHHYLIQIVVTIAVGAIALLLVAGALYFLHVPAPATNTTTPPVQGIVHMRIITEDGARSVTTYDLATKTLTVDASADQNAVAMRTQSVTLDDGSIIHLDTLGIILTAGTVTHTLVASPVPPDKGTYLAVWNDGQLIAWTSPVDRSVQIFSRTQRGVYIPFYIDATLKPNSIAFSDDGSALVALTQKQDTTEVSAINLETKQTIILDPIPGYADLITP